MCLFCCSVLFLYRLLSSKRLKIISTWQKKQEKNGMVSVHFVVFSACHFALFENLTVFIFSHCVICVLSSYPSKVPDVLV